MMNIAIKIIGKKDASSLIKDFHYLGKKGFRSGVIFGLFDKNTLCGCAVYHGVSAPETCVGAFGLGRSEQNGIWELGRLVLRPEYNGKNYGSYLVGNSLRLLKKNHQARAVISYADSSLHNGGIYRACNFLYCGLSTAKKDFYIHGVKQERGKTKGVEGGVWVPRPQKHRFVYMFDKKLKLLWPIIPYQKSV